MSAEFEEFMKLNGIKHITSAAYHPSSNGQVERAVQTFESKLKAMEVEPGSLSLKLSRFLLSYRTIPHTTTGLTPSQLFLGREVRTKMYLLKLLGHDSQSRLKTKRILYT